MQKARVASVSYLNALPLTWGLTRGAQRQLFDMTFVPPADCARLLQDGMADMALIPSIEFERIKGLLAVPGTGVSSRREVRSVLLATRRQPAEIRSLAVDSCSRTSVALALVVLARRHGARPLVEPMAPDPAAMLERHDAALIIGDPALRASVLPGAWPDGTTVIDLAAEWHALTGLPFVFAFWACRPVLRAAAMREALESSLEEGLAAIDTIAEEEADRTGVSAAAIASYLRRNIHYRLGPVESESLRLFYRMCREEAILPGYARGAGPARSSLTLNNG
ncbi:MAG TPA: menaquinone biosynthesis protein [Candidatus Polarisedimenticolia bacterium]|nr:menaquinone biosynthesis protein [Candidatus Polarisedimenticolia bacterium]